MSTSEQTKTSDLLSTAHDQKLPALLQRWQLLSEQQQNISAAIRIFNRNVEDFNNGIEVFPNSLVNGLLNKKHKLDTFNDSQADSGFEYRPDIHRSLPLYSERFFALI
ncbi:LemA family protein [uncultured Cedecea sp.]|uniref:LemA family protein n=1 Tax=uncultured Cedecea sp. TaxID=988762 RepID=UPI00260A6281|nr:LemA family protein [uncultured Cedecea sp.]